MLIDWGIEFSKTKRIPTSQNTGLYCPTSEVTYTTVPKRSVACLFRLLVPYSAIPRVYQDRRRPFFQIIRVNIRQITNRKKFEREEPRALCQTAFKVHFRVSWSVYFSWFASCKPVNSPTCSTVNVVIYVVKSRD